MTGPQEIPSIPDVTDIQEEPSGKKDALEYDPESDSYRAMFDSSSESVCWAIVSMVAAISGTDPTALPPLGSVIDADALNAILNSSTSNQSAGDVHVTFQYGGHEVTVHSYGIIVVQTG